jgi:hypothetical protein
MLSRLDYQSGITGQKPDFEWIVLYTSSSKDASAVVVSKNDFELQFVCDHKAYWFETKSVQEANYLAGFLNSGLANSLIKDFQSKGLMGPRDVHKTILMLPLPKFAANNILHTNIAKLALDCAQEAKTVVNNEAKARLDTHSLGQLRTKIRSRLTKLIEEIDAAVGQIILANKGLSFKVTTNKRNRKTANPRDLFQ